MSNPKVISRGSFGDKINNFFMKEHETKELPDNWESIPSINQALKTGFLKFVTPPVKVDEPKKGKGQIVKKQIEEPEAVIVGEIEKKEALSDKLVDDYLGRNTKTVRKAIVEDNLDKKFLKKLESEEKKGKKRNSILDTIRRALSRG